ncbi:MAG: hypothetical protein FWH04_05050 [Oscillospiraceae bacterium]|nr:hypothetical protein [Oscillospiraceae bacterium]
MKLFAYVVVLVLVLFLSACNQAKDPFEQYPLDGFTPDGSRWGAEIDFELGGDMLEAQIRDIYENTRNYIGKIIKIEGFFGSDPSLKHPFVRQYVLGCCEGEIAPFGLPVNWGIEYPAAGTWTEAIGVLVSDKKGEIYLELLSLTKIPEPMDAHKPES